MILSNVPSDTTILGIYTCKVIWCCNYTFWNLSLGYLNICMQKIWVESIFSLWNSIFIIFVPFGVWVDTWVFFKTMITHLYKILNAHNTELYFLCWYIISYVLFKIFDQLCSSKFRNIALYRWQNDKKCLRGQIYEHI